MYSKSEQLKNNKVKVKKKTMFEKKHKMKHKRVATDEDLVYFQWLRSEVRYCIVCNSPDVEYHHIKKCSNDKKDHSRLICLCKEHHTNSKTMSAHGNKKEFIKLFPLKSQEVLAKRMYDKFLESSFNNQDDEVELVYEETL